VNKLSRYLALIAYLLSIPGAAYVLLAYRRDAFAVYHARQSLALAVMLVLTPPAWAISAWAFAWVPLIGPVIAVSLFALVLVIYCGVAIGWLLGMSYALRGLARPLPVVGAWAQRWPFRMRTATPEPVAEPIERRSISDA